MRAAIVHDYLNQYGGAERVLEVLHELFPDAPVYTSIYAPERLPASYRSWDIRTSWLQRLPAIHRKHRLYLPLYPFAFSRLRLAGYQLIVSSSSAFAKSVPVPPGAVHVCYCHSPMRFAWDFESYAAREELPAPVRSLLTPFMAWLRRWDRTTAQRIQTIVANSRTVAERIRQYWGRDATVIHPPVDVDRARPAPPSEIGDFFLVVSRLVHYKRLDLVIEACNQLHLPLKIVGDGRARAALERLAGPTVQFLGAISDEEKFWLYARCRAAIFPAEDDFGIAQVEVQAAGRPAIALARGGARETVIDGVTGILFPEQSVDALVAALRRFEHLHLDSETIRRHAQRFRPERFKAEFTDVVRATLAVRTSPHRRREALVPWN
ncbi:glycosyltransferase [Thermomicrobium sp. 4228-Ro]|uniref:glycosyltransferase n=1 Tax=Thermomicrobium sp. 4228-Ro TaxID=2993937 RepID=UPI002248CCD4|nr:glycosyltransferase [Thermomicrobium sp. 4228-Ro]MCX2727839.1 glycosyltransferase [Thermomicrobium sp. 4228-Ro]